ncbi:hypothetical protein H4R24_003584 [Coemansia sp. RSA 988]|nr:hypothetical protein H4R24_003584 [Coemansia sp. RSA 988]
MERQVNARTRAARIFFPILMLFSRRLRNLLVICAGVLFICGTNWVFTSDTARSTAPLLYYTSLVYLILGYIYLATPLLMALGLLALILLCYTFSSTFRMRFRKNKGADFKQISQIPLVRYAGSSCPPARITLVSSPPSLHGGQHSLRRTEASVNETHEQHRLHDDIAIDMTMTGTSVSPDGASRPDALHSTTSLHSGTSNRRNSFLRIQILNPFVRIAHRLTRSRRQRASEAEMYKSQLTGPVPDFMPRDPEDNVCAICLCEYDGGDILRLLPCNHHMHQGCVDEWLHINQTCPLCKQAVTSDSEHHDEAVVHSSSDGDPTTTQNCRPANTESSTSETPMVSSVSQRQP